MHWWEVLIVNALTLVSGFIGGGWFAKRKARAEAENSEVTNLRDIIGTWRDAYSDLKIQREEFNKLWLELQNENIKMNQEIIDLQRKVNEIQSENIFLKTEIEKLKNEKN
ncbi:MAG: hypothetical protein K0B15_11780 [Lentimicrobium sp.]|nr:hypothetical protein [Lentimicrobium sp.]